MFFYPFHVHFYHCTACTVYFHCLHVHLLHVALNANQSIATYPPSRKLRLSCAPLSITAVHNLIIFIVITFSRPRLVVDFTTAGGDKRDNVKYRPATVHRRIMYRTGTIKLQQGRPECE